MDADHILECSDKQSFLVRFWQDDSGANLVEFGLVAAPFFTMLIGLFEVCVIFIIMTTMEHGVAEAARNIRTGELQEAGGSAATFKAEVCKQTFGLLDCNNKLKVDVKQYDGFNDAKNDDPIKNGKVDDSALGFQPGEGGDIIVARVFYEWDIITPLISGPLANLDGGKRLLQATVAFRNEPFES